MADDAENDDSWLYGDNANAPTLESSENNAEELKKSNEDEETEKNVEEKEEGEKQQQEDESQETNEEGEIEKQNGEGSDKEDSEEDSDDDDVNVVIGDIKTSSAYASSHTVKRGGITATVGDKVKQVQQQSGKFTVEEFDQPGMINGVPAVDYNLDSLEDKPWRKPGADITDYFNYGFNEDTWRAYCERQKRMRINESGAGLNPMNAMVGPPPNRRTTGSIDVIGGPQPKFGLPLGKMDAPKENVIQVMTADRREYSRKPGYPDLTMPPPNTFEEFPPEYPYPNEPEVFYSGYEPTQEHQWGPDNPAWQPQDIKSLTPGPMLPAAVPPVNMAPNLDVNVSMGSSHDSPPQRRRSRERDTSRSRSEKPRDRTRERSHRRERSRSRSRRHKSRSRSPSHRSHRKKKSRRREDSEER